MVPSLNCAVPKSHVTVLFSSLVIQNFFFLANDDSIVTLGSTIITSDRTFLTFDCTLIFFLTFDNIVLTLYNTNIICDCIFVTFGGPLIFLSH